MLPGTALHTTPRGVRRALGAYRVGSDPTTRVSDGEFWRATWTPDGPATVHLRWSASRGLDVQAWGAGADWAAANAPAMAGTLDPAEPLQAHHPAVAHAARHTPDLRIGRSGNLYHELIPVILGQRITGGEAVAQYRRLVCRFGSAAPGPHPTLRLPPRPDVLARITSWQLHPLGIERSRAGALTDVARHADRMWDWAALTPAECATNLHRLARVGEWTIGTVLGLALGDPDAVAVGDFHLKHVVCFALAGRVRGTDAEMLAHLAPYAGQRGRVVGLLAADGWSEPKFGPRQRVLPMARW